MQANIIHDVRTISLKRIVNARGGLLEIQRNDDDYFPGFGQLYITQTLPGITKAWYRHHHQIDQIALISGELLLVLFDSRPASPTHGLVQEIRVSAEAPLLIQIPVEIWHGFQATGDEAAILAHMNTIPFSAEATDEDRLAFNDARIPYQWPDIGDRCSGKQVRRAA
ncbi:MAG: dTDP-4-dehydrorhamnose 3,5-epimerase family protein [Rhodopirellula sp.]|nr:dTDP-4-dehydrorhamnose 3,5-epimerase family protein [Rhodopirellula sp.]